MIGTPSKPTTCTHEGIAVTIRYDQGDEIYYVDHDNWGVAAQTRSEVEAAFRADVDAWIAEGRPPHPTLDDLKKELAADGA